MPIGGPGDYATFIDTMNREMMRRSEWRLGQTAAIVDFGNFQHFHERFAAFAGSLRVALEVFCFPLVAAGFVTLPYSNSHRRLVPLSLLTWLPIEPEAVEVSHPKRTAEIAAYEAAWQKIRDFARATDNSDFTTIQVPYFVRPLPSVVGSFEDFRPEHVVFSEIRYSAGQQVDAEWLRLHPPRNYIQRFVILLLVNANLNMVKETLENRVGFQTFFGAFLSWMGVDTDSFHHFETQQFAAEQILRAHELGNKIKGLFDLVKRLRGVLAQARGRPTESHAADLCDVFASFQPYLDEVEDHVREFATIVDEREEGSLWFQALLRMLRSWGAETRDGGAIYYTSLAQGITESYDLTGISAEAKTLSIVLPARYIEKLLHNLRQNARRSFDESQSGEVCRQRFLLEAELVRDHLTLRFVSEGPEIPNDVRTRLFRAPINATSREGSRGVGLYALGLTLRTYGIARPVISQRSTFGPAFEFRIPVFFRRRSTDTEGVDSWNE